MAGFSLVFANPFFIVSSFVRFSDGTNQRYPLLLLGGRGACLLLESHRCRGISDARRIDRREVIACHVCAASSLITPFKLPARPPLAPDARKEEELAESEPRLGRSRSTGRLKLARTIDPRPS